MKHIIVAIVLLAAYARPAAAQGTSPSSHETALELLQLLHIEKTLEVSVDVTLDVQLRQHPELAPFKATMRQFMEKYLGWDYLKDSYAKLYEDAFTEAEMRELIVFYRTPVGQKVLSALPDLIKQSVALGEQTVLQHQGELQDRLQQRSDEIAEIKASSGLDVDDDVVSLAEGTWGWPDGETSCERNPESVTFSMDRQLMTFTFEEPIKGLGQSPQSSFIYKIQEVGPNYIRAAIEGETRTTDTGELVVWDLILQGKDAFCWHRTDWPENSCTKPLTRCPQ